MAGITHLVCEIAALDADLRSQPMCSVSECGGVGYHYKQAAGATHRPVGEHGRDDEALQRGEKNRRKGVLCRDAAVRLVSG